MSRTLVVQSSNAGAQAPDSGKAAIQDSDTDTSLQRLERERRSRPCFLSIDMRTRCAGRCQQHKFNDRVHYLDPGSRELFEQGLRRYNGVYTVGTYEDIVARASHVPPDSAGVADRQSARCPVPPTGMSAGAGESLPVLAGGGQNPARLTLGYFRRRSEPRLTYATVLAVGIEGETMAAVSRDISVNGLQLGLRGYPGVEHGSEIRVNFEELAHLQDAPDLSQVGYQVVKVRRRESGTLLHLRRIPAAGADEVAGFLAGFIERYHHRYKLDVNDEYRSVFSWLYERSYAENTSTVPLFIERGEDRRLRLQALAMSYGNAHLLRFFCTGEDSYNFTPLCPPQRLARLEQGEAYTLAMYRHRGERDQGMRIHSLADFECDPGAHFTSFLAFVLAQPEHCIVRVMPGSGRLMDVPRAKIDEISRRLHEKSPVDTRALRQRVNRLQLLACMSDVSADIRRSLASTSVPVTEQDMSGLSVWVGGERRALGSGAVQQRLAARLSLLSPELIRFGYVERRREERYLVEIAVEIRAGDRHFGGMTRDISCRGMCVRLRGNAQVARRELVKLSLTILQKKVGLDLTGIPYRVVDVRRCEDDSLLMLERVADSHHPGLNAFLAELISRNRHKLKVDVGDIHSAAVSRIYESLLAANTPCLPVFIGASEEGGVHLQFIGLPQGGNSLARFFAAGGEPDFRALNEDRFVNAIHDALQIVSRQTGHTGVRPAPFELEAYFYHEPVGKTGRTAIRMHTELDFSDQSEQRDFEAWLAERGDWLKVRVLATGTGSLDAGDLENMIMPLRQQSRHKATRLSDLLHSLVGYAELIDITPGESAAGN